MWEWVYECMSESECECVRVWECASVRVKVWECESVRVWEWEYEWECESVRVWECENVWEWECVKEWECEWECESVRVWVRVWKCESVRVWEWKCQSVRVWKCESESVWKSKYHSRSLTWIATNRLRTCFGSSTVTTLTNHFWMICDFFLTSIDCFHKLQSQWCLKKKKKKKWIRVILEILIEQQIKTDYSTEWTK
jgi:hypothetical protein